MGTRGRGSAVSACTHPNQSLQRCIPLKPCYNVPSCSPPSLKKDTSMPSSKRKKKTFSQNQEPHRTDRNFTYSAPDTGNTQLEKCANRPSLQEMKESAQPEPLLRVPVTAPLLRGKGEKRQPNGGSSLAVRPQRRVLPRRADFPSLAVAGSGPLPMRSVAQPATQRESLLPG
jgi:hypothetical protein